MAKSLLCQSTKWFNHSIYKFKLNTGNFVVYMLNAYATHIIEQTFTSSNPQTQNVIHTFCYSFFIQFFGPFAVIHICLLIHLIQSNIDFSTIWASDTVHCTFCMMCAWNYIYPFEQFKYLSICSCPFSYSLETIDNQTNSPEQRPIQCIWVNE